MAMVDKKNSQHKDHEEGFYDAAFNRDTFEEYYKSQLEQDAQKPPRTVNPEEFKKRKAWDHPVGKPWRNEIERTEDLWSDHSIYLEKKKEQQERIQLFYVLEQFYEESRQNPNQNSKGQKLIKEYFADPDNINFFDMNKLV